jgi:hypothetical protein
MTKVKKEFFGNARIDFITKFILIYNPCATSSQAAAHVVQVASQFLQQSMCFACLAHSTAHALHTSAHRACRRLRKCEFRASKRAHSIQMSAQSRQIGIQLVMLLSRHSAIHISQAIVQAKQESILSLVVVIIDLFRELQK